MCFTKSVSHLHAILLRSQIFSVLSWLPETILLQSPKNLAAKTLPLCPVKVLFKKHGISISNYINFSLTSLKKELATKYKPNASAV